MIKPSATKLRFIFLSTVAVVAVPAIAFANGMPPTTSTATTYRPNYAPPTSNSMSPYGFYNPALGPVGAGAAANALNQVTGVDPSPTPVDPTTSQVPAPAGLPPSPAAATDLLAPDDPGSPPPPVPAAADLPMPDASPPSPLPQPPDAPNPQVSVQYDRDNPNIRDTTVQEVDPATGNIIITVTVRNMTTGEALGRVVQVDAPNGMFISKTTTAYGRDKNGNRITTTSTVDSNLNRSTSTTSDPSNTQLGIQTDQQLNLGIAKTAAQSTLNQLNDLLNSP